ncbi:MAG: phosphoribosylglycinamide formyltransferase [Candidatus Peribacteraceae bacterium]|jgi:phosphoribosylglycinamide formyltransferase-1
MHFIVLSSSRGTTFQAILDRIAEGALTMQCLGLITDRADRGCIQQAQAANVPVRIVEKEADTTKEDYERRLTQAVAELQGDVPAAEIILAAAGWMWILTPAFAKEWRIINVHPALLPKYGGKGMYGHHVHEAVLASGDQESGVTIHLMDGGVDTGKILLQKTCPVLPEDTPATLQARVQELEKKWYPEVLAMIERGEMRL